MIEEVVDGDEGLAIGRAWFQALDVDGSVVVRYEKESESEAMAVKAGRFVRVKVTASSDVDLDSVFESDSTENAGLRNFGDSDCASCNATSSLVFAPELDLD